MIRRLLVANRGEIACRIIRTAHRMGIECAAIHSDADTRALHVQLADAAFHVGGAASRDSYLNQHRIIEVARQWQADAIHPGYGFLSENSEFAAAVEAAGIRFVGPSSQAIADMGSKSRAKVLMAEAGVPLLPGYHGDVQDPRQLADEAEKVGYPLLIKAVAGGGGRGLRVVNSSDGFDAALQAVIRESEAAFGDSRVLLEKYLPDARHVEVQIFADSHGNVVHLFERDCSLQRRHQKLIEEAPAPGISEALRRQMGEAAVLAARAITYSGAGTVEFLLQDQSFHFMEMNTRLQVEHPVTEAITGQDLVEWQIRVAQGEKLPLTQEEIVHEGWAIEVRINAESPDRDFMPATGLVETLVWPDIEGVRVDSGFRAGDHISMHYDSLLAKLIVRADDRPAAIHKLIRALSLTRLEGVSTNIDFLIALLSQPAFASGEISTRFLQNHQQALASALERTAFDRLANSSNPAGAVPIAWQSLESWRSLGHNPFSRRFHLLGEPSPASRETAGHSGAANGDALLSPLPGKIIAVYVEDGQAVTQGQALLTLEAMKMEHTITASSDGMIGRVTCTTGELVKPDQLLIEFAGAHD